MAKYVRLTLNVSGTVLIGTAVAQSAPLVLAGTAVAQSAPLVIAGTAVSQSTPLVLAPSAKPRHTCRESCSGKLLLLDSAPHPR